ncbi:MAG: hypothetical protein QG597_1927, partial [Actinomycetota bacterium]|nr:hypothetical protein [Actinomycetota bacterium]
HLTTRPTRPDQGTPWKRRAHRRLPRALLGTCNAIKIQYDWRESQRTHSVDPGSETDDTTAYRHYWELCVLMALRDGLRSGDVHVLGSRRYADPASFLGVGTAAGRGLRPGRQTGRRGAGPGRRGRGAAHDPGRPGVLADPWRRGRGRASGRGRGAGHPGVGCRGRPGRGGQAAGGDHRDAAPGAGERCWWRSTLEPGSPTT